MNFKEIQELLRLISKLELTEFKLKEGEFELSVRTKNFTSAKGGVPILSQGLPAAAYSLPQAVAEPVVQVSTSPAPQDTPIAAAPSGDTNYVPIKSPIVGTFYRSPSPDKGPYVKVGDKIETGTTVCIIEAMKLFNEIEADSSGRIVKILVEDAQPVEYDQVLFLLDPKG